MPETKPDLEQVSAEYAKQFGQPIEVREARRGWIQVPPERLRAAAAWLKNNGFAHMATITGVDTGTSFEVLYHLSRAGEIITIRVVLSHENPEVDSLVGLMPGAILYEREIQDLFGIKVKDHPDPRVLVLPEGWPEGEHPLRKDWVRYGGGDASA